MVKTKLNRVSSATPVPAIIDDPNTCPVDVPNTSPVELVPSDTGAPPSSKLTQFNPDASKCCPSGIPV